jgi:5-methyltetrahydropteroyltriglutamate--homocysteine methyltransferase
MKLPILPTTVIGSYSMPEWLERAKNDYLSRRLSRRDLDEMHDAVRKAAIKDQESAGIDIVTDGELQRDNMIDYFTERLPGVQVDLGSKRFYYDFYETSVRSKLATGSLGLTDEVRFLRKYSEHPAKVSVSGPHTLVKRIRNQFYAGEPEFALDLGRALNFELKELARAGATELQIDEPYYSGFPEDLPWAVKAINAAVEGVDAHVTLHICYGNRYGKPSFEGSYRYLFPTILEARVHALSLEFARRGEEDLQLFKEFKAPFTLGLGVIDVKTQEIEPPALVADRIRRALEVVPAERLVINPDCGCVHLPRDVAFNKLIAMVEGTKMVRAELGK